MGRGIIYWIFQRPKFCCCLPVRACVIIMSLLGLVLASLLSIILWFEVASTHTLTGSERAAFIGAGVVESLLALLSAVGFIGAIVRKQTFVTAYCIGLYIHFVLNLGVAGYFLFVIVHATHSDAVAACQHAITNTDAQGQCTNLLGVAKWIYVTVASVLLFVELYGAIVATRYVYQVRTEKRAARLPMHERGASDSSRLIPGFVRYSDPAGEQVYDSYYYPPKHEQGVSEYSLTTDAEGTQPMGLYDPPTKGLPSGELYGQKSYTDEGERELRKSSTSPHATNGEPGHEGEPPAYV